MMNIPLIKLFNFKKIPVELDPFFFLIFLISPISIAIAAFLSILVHELAHAFVANRKGWHVQKVEINLFGGYALMDANIHERDSIPILAAGPLSNLALYLISLAILPFVNIPFINAFAYVNLFLFIFNSLPIYPLDGGKILKDFLYLKINRQKAIKISGYISLVFSIILCITSLILGYLIMSLFSIMFIYYSLKNLKIIK